MLVSCRIGYRKKRSKGTCHYLSPKSQLHGKADQNSYCAYALLRTASENHPENHNATSNNITPIRPCNAIVPQTKSLGYPPHRSCLNLTRDPLHLSPLYFELSPFSFRKYCQDGCMMIYFVLGGYRRRVFPHMFTIHVRSRQYEG